MLLFTPAVGQNKKISLKKRLSNTIKIDDDCSCDSHKARGFLN